MRTRRPLIQSTQTTATEVSETPVDVVIDFSTESIEIPASATLTVNNFVDTEFTPPPCSEFTLATASSLTSIDLSNLTAAESITITGALFLVTVGVATLNCTQFLCQDASLDETSVDNICIAIAAGTGIDGTLNLSGGSSVAPTIDSAAARATLTGRGWTLVFN